MRRKFAMSAGDAIGADQLRPQYKLQCQALSQLARHPSLSFEPEGTPC